MKILVVEDDRNVAETVKVSLAAHSHNVEVASDGADGLFMAKSYDYDAIVLDNALPRKDGLTVCRELRASGKNTPILFLSVMDDTESKVTALEQGADDYIAKPFSLEELRARIGAVTRRSPDLKDPVLRIRDLMLDTNTRIVSRAGKRLDLTRKEFGMLEYFMKNQGKVISRAELMEHIWTADSNPFSNTVEAHIRNLRKKLNAGGKANLIVNVPGRGYIMDALRMKN